MGFVRPNALQIKFPEKEQLRSSLELPRATSVLLQQEGVGVCVFPPTKGSRALGKAGRWSSLLLQFASASVVARASCVFQDSAGNRKNMMSVVEFHDGGFGFPCTNPLKMMF